MTFEAANLRSKYFFKLEKEKWPICCENSGLGQVRLDWVMLGQVPLFAKRVDYY